MSKFEQALTAAKQFLKDRKTTNLLLIDTAVDDMAAAHAEAVAELAYYQGAADKLARYVLRLKKAEFEQGNLTIRQLVELAEAVREGDDQALAATEERAGHGTDDGEEG